MILHRFFSMENIFQECIFVQNLFQQIRPLNSVLNDCCSTMSAQYKTMLRFIAGHFLELLFLLMHDLDVYLMLEVHLGNIRMEINGMLNPLGWAD